MEKKKQQHAELKERTALAMNCAAFAVNSALVVRAISNSSMKSLTHFLSAGTEPDRLFVEGGDHTDFRPELLPRFADSVGQSKYLKSLTFYAVNNMQPPQLLSLILTIFAANRSVESLTLEDCKLFPGERIKRVIKALSADPAIESLSLRCNRLGPGGIPSELFSLERVVRLNISSNQITAKCGAQEIADGLRRTKVLAELDLGYNDLRDEGVSEIAAALLQNRSLIGLNLESNLIRAKGVKALAEVLRENRTLAGLDLSENDIGNDGAKDLAEALEFNGALKRLNIGYNSITAGYQISRMLLRNHGVEELVLAGNRFWQKESDDISEALVLNRSLKKLDLHGCFLGTVAGHALARLLCKQPPNLSLITAESVDMGKTALLDIAAAALRNPNWTSGRLRMTVMPVLTESAINMQSQGITGADLTELAKPLSADRTVTLVNLGENRLEQTGTLLISSVLAHNIALRSLFLHNCAITAEGAKCLAGGLMSNKATAIASLRLDVNQIGDLGTEAIAQMLCTNTSITGLSLASNGIGDAGAIALGKALAANKTLSQLSLGENRIAREGAAGIASGLVHNIGLRALDLQRNRLGVEGAVELSKGVRENKTLVNFSVPGNAVGNAGAAAILSAATSLVQISLGANGISDLGKVAGMSANARELRLLDLGGNYISDKGAEQVAEGIEKSGSMTVCNLHHNAISDRGAIRLAAALKQNERIVHLNLSFNPIGDKGWRALTDVAAHRKTSTVDYGV